MDAGKEAEAGDPKLYRWEGTGTLRKDARPRRSVAGAGAWRTCPSRGAVRAARGWLEGPQARRFRFRFGPASVPEVGRAAMAYSTVQRVALASGLVLAVSLLLPKAFLSRGKRQEPPPAPEGKRRPASLGRPAPESCFRVGGLQGPRSLPTSPRKGPEKGTGQRLGSAKPRGSSGISGQRPNSTGLGSLPSSPRKGRECMHASRASSR